MDVPLNCCGLQVDTGGYVMEYYGSGLNPVEQKFYLKIVHTIRSHLLFVKADQITEKESFFKCISAVQYDYPDLFYVDFSRIQYVAFDDGWEYRPQYLYNKDQILQKQAEIGNIIRKMIYEMKKRDLSSVYEKCGYIHAYLVRKCTYDDAALDNPEKRRAAYTIEGPVLEKTGVCQGIALAYRLICMQCGIDAIVVRGISLRPGTTTYEGHAWNLIRVGKRAAQIDATWDMCLTLQDWPIRYDYFFLPDIDMMRDHQYVGYPICRKMKLSYFERSQSLFGALNELDGFIEKQIRAQNHKSKPGEYYFHFKMANRKETEENIKNYVLDVLGRYATRGYACTVSTNSPQSVFSYKVEIK